MKWKRVGRGCRNDLDTPTDPARCDPLFGGHGFFTRRRWTMAFLLIGRWE